MLEGSAATDIGTSGESSIEYIGILEASVVSGSWVLEESATEDIGMSEKSSMEYFGMVEEPVDKSPGLFGRSVVRNLRVRRLDEELKLDTTVAL